MTELFERLAIKAACQRTIGLFWGDSRSCFCLDLATGAATGLGLHAAEWLDETEWAPLRGEALAQTRQRRPALAREIELETPASPDPKGLEEIVRKLQANAKDGLVGWRDTDYEDFGREDIHCRRICLHELPRFGQLSSSSTTVFLLSALDDCTSPCGSMTKGPRTLGDERLARARSFVRTIDIDLITTLLHSVKTEGSSKKHVWYDADSCDGHTDHMEVWQVALARGGLAAVSELPWDELVRTVSMLASALLATSRTGDVCDLHWPFNARRAECHALQAALWAWLALVGESDLTPATCWPPEDVRGTLRAPKEADLSDSAHARRQDVYRMLQARLGWADLPLPSWRDW